ncbi:hypothetical protein CLU79DRAFT_706119, partial [Phycomyces nitens]
INSQLLVQVFNRLIDCVFKESKCCWPFSKGCIVGLIFSLVLVMYNALSWL